MPLAEWVRARSALHRKTLTGKKLHDWGICPARLCNSCRLLMAGRTFLRRAAVDRDVKIFTAALLRMAQPAGYVLVCAV